MSTEVVAKKRPFGITALAILVIVVAVGQLALAMSDDWGKSIRCGLWWIVALIPVTRILLSLTYIVIAIGLLRLWKWARFLAIAYCALAIGGALTVITAKFWPTELLASFWFVLCVAGLHMVCLSYMFARNVKQAFSVS